MTLKEQIAILQAIEAGKTVQYKRIGEMKWFDCTPTPALGVYLCSSQEYRIKPEPRVVWVEFNQFGTITGVSLHEHHLMGGFKFVEAVE